jgi:hypothetical protein
VERCPKETLRKSVELSTPRSDGASQRSARSAAVHVPGPETHIQDLKSYGRDRKEIDRDQIREVVGEEGLPGLRQWPLARTMYLATLVWRISIPNFSSSP